MVEENWRSSVTSVRPPPALGRHVVDHLRRLIISVELPAGTHLVESQLSETFDVSRGPIRDALRQLEIEGLVESRRRGVFVKGLSQDDIDELYSLRQLIEAEAVRLCRTTGADLAPAQEALSRMSTAAKANDTAQFAEADLDFHSAFYAISGHRRLASVWQQYLPTFAGMLSITNAEDRDLEPVYRDHVDLLKLIGEGPEEAALELLHTHIDGSRQRMSTAYARSTETQNAPTTQELPA